MCPGSDAPEPPWPSVLHAKPARMVRAARPRRDPATVDDRRGRSDIAEALDRGLKVPVKNIDPEESRAHFDWLSMFAGQHMPSSSAITREKLNWKPTGPNLIADLESTTLAQS